MRFALCGVALLAVLASVAAQAAPQQIAFPAADGLIGWLYAPQAAGPHPAVVALHGCAGLNDRTGAPGARHADWGERLAAAGFVVLFPDSFGSRGLPSLCRESDRTVRPSRERVADANAARRYLAARADVDARSIALLGWSNGGSASSTLFRKMRRTASISPAPSHSIQAVGFRLKAAAGPPACRCTS